MRHLMRLFHLFIFSLIVSCSNRETASPEWTVLLYMAADNNLDTAVSRDLEEVRAASASSQVNVIVQVDTRGGTTKRYRLANGKLNLISDLGELDMSQPDVLRSFIVESVRDYPAAKTALILWSHGNGWQSGLDKRVFAVIEDLSGRKPGYPISNKELAETLADAQMQTGKKIDILGIDACIMATVEAAYEFRSSATLLVASQELVQGNGWDYRDILSRLAEAPEIGAEEYAKKLVESYADYAESAQYGFGDQAISAIRLGEAIETLALEIDLLARTLLTDLENPASRPVAVANIRTARASVQEFDQASYPGMYVDLLDFATKLNASPALATAFGNAVVHKYHGKERPMASGISIVFVDKVRVSSYSSRYYHDDYRNYDPAAKTGSVSSFIKLYNWDELMNEAAPL